MEIDCITTITLFVTLSYPLLIIGHIICTLLFHFLNGKFHPFGLILINNKPWRAKKVKDLYDKTRALEKTKEKIFSSEILFLRIESISKWANKTFYSYTQKWLYFCKVSYVQIVSMCASCARHHDLPQQTVVTVHNV